MPANIKFFLCRNKENLFMKDRKSVNRSKNNAVSGFNNSFINSLSSWSAPFSDVASKASIRHEYRDPSLLDASPCDSYLVAAALRSLRFFFPKVSELPQILHFSRLNISSFSMKRVNRYQHFAMP